MSGILDHSSHFSLDTSSKPVTTLAAQQLLASQLVNPPSQVELRESRTGKGLGVWAKEAVPKGTKFGPFLGKWAVEPTDPKYAWEVSE